MTEEFRKNAGLIFQGVQCLGFVVGAVWAYFKFWREGIHRPRIEFDVSCHTVGIEGDQRILTFDVIARNKGLVEHRFCRISLPIRGIRNGTSLSRRDDGRLNFPDVLLRAELVTKELGYYFVRPGIEQHFTFTTIVDADYRFILVRPAFQYEGSEDLHTSERVFDLFQKTT
jgi:hypothetical protein